MAIKARRHWRGGFRDGEGRTAPVLFPGIKALRSEFPANRLLTRRWPARITLVVLAPVGGVPLPPALAGEIEDVLRDGGAVEIFAASHPDLDAALAAIKAASGLSAICRAAARNRR